MALLSAAVVGLGQAGSRFDEEPRPSTWSHAGAYLAAADHYRLVGGADIDSNNRERFQRRCPDAKVFDNAPEMMVELKPDVVSVCTPPSGRATLVERIFEHHRPKVLICEKPLEIKTEARRRLVQICARSGTTLIVNYNRRYATIYRKVRAAIASGRLATPTSITVMAPNRIWSIGSHAVNMLLFMAGEFPVAWRSLYLPNLNEGGEPAYDFMGRFPAGTAGRVLTTGRRAMLMFEVDVIGSRGRIQVQRNGEIATFTPFVESAEYVGYQTLGEPSPLHETDPTESTFEIMVREAADLARTGGSPSSTGEHAIAGEEILDALAANAGEGDCR